MRQNIIILFLVLFSNLLSAQDSIHVNSKNRLKDTTALMDVFSKSKIDVNAKSFFMSTINDGSLKDDYAFASGIGIGLTSKSFHGFQFGFSSFVIYNLYSSDLSQLDETTHAPNRYEVGLFDIQNTDSKYNLVRIENLFLKYSISKSAITFGKMKLNTPFLNPQDGRMNVTLEEGVLLNIAEIKKIQINGGWFWGISPRSTTKWFMVENSIGLYPSGVTESGIKSNYLNNINSGGVGIANIQINPNKNVKINLWDMLVDNVLNTSMIEINNELGKKNKFYQGVMYVHQDAIKNGGNSDQSKTYVLKGSQSNVISGQIGIKNKRINTSINYTHITGDGRYLMPREWGRDPFYTFMPRERNEGFGNVNAFTTKTTYMFRNEKLKTGLTYGYFQLPDVNDYRLNKYGMPSYHQINIDISYSFAKIFKGLDVKFISAYKLKQGETYGNAKYVYNKVNMCNFNFIIDFKI